MVRVGQDERSKLFDEYAVHCCSLMLYLSTESASLRETDLCPQCIVTSSKKRLKSHYPSTSYSKMLVFRFFQAILPFLLICLLCPKFNSCLQYM